MKTTTTNQIMYHCGYCDTPYISEHSCKRCEEQCKAKLELCKLEVPKFQPGDIVKVKQGSIDVYKYLQIKDVKAQYSTQFYYAYTSEQRISGYFIGFCDVAMYELVLTNEQRQKAITNFIGQLMGTIGINREYCSVVFNCKTGKLEATISKDI